MSGRILVAALLAASSASAATVGVVYTRMVAPRHVGTTATVGLGASSPGTVKSAVVIGAAETVFAPFADSTADRDAPVCPTKADHGGCVMVSRASDFRLEILGYTIAIPPLWLGRDSEDQFAGGRDGVFRLTSDPRIFKVAAHSRRRFDLGGEGDSTAQSDSGNAGAYETANENQSVSRGDLSTGGGVPPGLGVNPSTWWPDGSTPAVFLANIDGSGGFFPSPFFPLDRTSAAESNPQPVASPPADVPAPPQFSRGSSQTSVPEPTTWLMMAAGLATLGLLKRRRTVAAIGSRPG